jgi:hypothetical protein
MASITVYGADRTESHALAANGSLSKRDDRVGQRVAEDGEDLTAHMVEMAGCELVGGWMPWRYRMTLGSMRLVPTNTSVESMSEV